MAKIDELVIQIKADTQQLKKELKQIEGKIRTTGAAGGAAFGSMAGSLNKMRVGALAAVGGLVAVGGALKSITDTGIMFEDLKDSLDTVFGGIEQGDKALQKIVEFAQTTPFQIEDATKAFISLKSSGIEPSMEMLQTFADTASTSIDQLGAFEAMVRLVQRSAAGGLGLEEINQLDDRGIPATKILTEALGKSREELSTFGKTAEGAAQMVELLIKGLQQRFGGAMENKMDNLSTKASNMTIAFKDLANELFKGGIGTFFKDLADDLGRVATNIAESIRASRDGPSIRDLTATQKEVRTKGKRGRETVTMETVFTDDPKQQKEILELLLREQEIKLFHLGIEKQSADTQRDRVNIQKRINSAIEHQTVLQTALDSLTGKTVQKKKEEVEDANRANQSQIEFLTTFNKLLADSVDPIDEINQQLLMVQELLGKTDAKGALLISEEDAEKVTAYLNKIKAEMADTGNVTDELALILEQATDQFANDFINALQSGENALVSFRNLVGDMIQQVIAEFLKMKVIKPLMNALFTAVGLPTMPMDTSAGGGTIQGGRPTLVGERGPEIFVPNTGGTIMNNMNSRNAMGGGTPINIYQNLNFATGVVPTVRAEVTKMMPQIADVTKAAVQESAMRGGTFRRSLVGG
jgi:tape measure domain-containing protein